MARKEANFDLFIHDLLVEAGIKADTQGSNESKKGFLLLIKDWR